MSASLKRTLNRRAVRRTKRRAKLDELYSSFNRVQSEIAESDSDISGVDDESGGGDSIGDVGGNFSADEQESGNVDDNGAGEEHAEVQDLDSGSSDHVEESEGCDSDGSGADVDSDTEQEPGFENDAEKEQYVIDTVRDWGQSPGLLSMSKLDDLLHRLSVVFKRMPLTYTTLFQCDYQFDIAELPSGGTLWYKGIRANLDALDLKDYLRRFHKITLDIGMDGLPPKNAKLWPILGDLIGTDNSPFVIAVYRGTTDPRSVQEYLEKYVAELGDLFQNGYAYNGQMYEVVIRKYILDAVARSFIKCCSRHNGYEGCEKCIVVGTYHDNRMTFTDLDQPLRTDESFRQKDHPGHHRGVSPLEALGTGLVSQFSLDPMHLVFAGVMKRILTYWLHIPGPWKLHQEIIDLISTIFVFLRQYCPTDFNRKPCFLSFFKSLKCTQLRRILLYDGILAFKDLVDENIYKNFLLLHCSIYILSSKSLISEKRDLAKQLLKLFVQHSAQIYGRQFVVYNVHSLIHLPDEIDDNLTLDDIAAFKFENQLKTIKETLRSGLHQLQQLARRDQEKKSTQVKLSSKADHVVLSLKQRRGFCGNMGGQHYKKFKAKGLMLKVGKADSCFRTKDVDIVVLQDIVLRQRKIYLVGHKFQLSEDFYDYPVPSTDLGICRLSELGRRLVVFRLRDVHSKCYLMRDGGHHFLVLRFFSTDKDDNQYFEVGLADWLVGDLNDDMVGLTKWPPPHRPATPLIKGQCPPDPSWEEHKVQVMRFYDTFIKARTAVPRFLVDSNYETEAPDSGPQKKRRRIRPNRFESSSSEDEIQLRTVQKPIVAPPPSVHQITGNAKTTVRKGQGLTQAEQKKKERGELMERLKAARASAASLMKSPRKSPWKITPRKESTTPKQKEVIENQPEESLGIHFLAGEDLENSVEMDLPCTTSEPDATRSPPTFSTFSQLPDETSFCLSPASAQAVSKDIRNRAASSCSAVSNSSINIMPGISKSKGTSSSIPKSLVDGRRRLFEVQSKSVSERLEALEASCLNLEVLASETSAKTDVVLMNLGRLQRSLVPNEKRICKPHGMPKLPLASREELKKFEDFLSESDNNLAGACDYFSSYIRTLVPDPERASARAILAKLMYNTLAQGMNLNGGNGKIGIRELNIYKVFQGTLQTAFKSSDLSVAEDALQKWLKDAKWRKQTTSRQISTPSPKKSSKPKNT